jgi:hypothetical protein
VSPAIVIPESPRIKPRIRWYDYRRAERRVEQYLYPSRLADQNYLPARADIRLDSLDPWTGKVHGAEVGRWSPAAGWRGTSGGGCLAPVAWQRHAWTAAQNPSQPRSESVTVGRADGGHELCLEYVFYVTALQRIIGRQGGRARASRQTRQHWQTRSSLSLAGQPLLLRWQGPCQPVASDSDAAVSDSDSFKFPTVSCSSFRQ